MSVHAHPHTKPKHETHTHTHNQTHHITHASPKKHTPRQQEQENSNLPHKDDVTGVGQKGGHARGKVVQPANQHTKETRDDQDVRLLANGRAQGAGHLVQNVSTVTTVQWKNYASGCGSKWGIA